MRKIIRLSGLVLMGVGYIWFLLWLAFAIVPLPRLIFTDANEKYPPTRMYSHAEVLEAVRGAIIKFKDNSIQIMVPASLMLLGGILIDRARKCSTDRLGDQGKKR